MAPLLELPVDCAPPAAVPPRAILDQPAALDLWLRERGQPPLRAKQIRRQILVNRAESFADMTDLPGRLRDQLAADWSPLGTAVEHDRTADDGTRKLVLRLHDGGRIECVMIPDGRRRTACISTQVGCGMGCVFCASGIGGVVRNLSAGEMVEQLVRLRNLLPADERLTHVVVMGMGEPLANLDALLDALAVVGRKDALDIGARHVTISTVGLPAKMRKLARSGKAYHLAVSLHAPNDALRNRVVPTNAAIGLDAILAAADEFYATTGRQVTYEYVLLGRLNDGPTEARQLAGLLRGRHAHVNLIPFNPVDGLPYRRPDGDAIAAFALVIRKAGISVKVRRTKGGSIAAACGQLRRATETAGPDQGFNR